MRTRTRRARPAGLPDADNEWFLLWLCVGREPTRYNIPQERHYASVSVLSSSWIVWVTRPAVRLLLGGGIFSSNCQSVSKEDESSVRLDRGRRAGVDMVDMDGVAMLESYSEPSAGPSCMPSVEVMMLEVVAKKMPVKAPTTAPHAIYLHVRQGGREDAGETRTDKCVQGLGRRWSA